METEEEALIRAVRESPEDDTPRLVYADWLQEQPPLVTKCGNCDGHGRSKPAFKWVCKACGSHGTLRLYCQACRSGRIRPATRKDGVRCSECLGSGKFEADYAARAEFIRLQCEFAKLGSTDRGCPDMVERNEYRWRKGNCVCRGCEIRRLEHDLKNGHDLVFYSDVKWMAYRSVWQRGFVEKVVLPFNGLLGWRQNATDIIASKIVVLREVELTTWPDSWIPGWDAEDFATANRAYVRLALAEQLSKEYPGHCPGYPIKFTLPMVSE